MAHQLDYSCEPRAEGVPPQYNNNEGQQHTGNNNNNTQVNYPLTPLTNSQFS